MILGRELGKTLRPGDVVLLRGPLGAGKTVFVKGLAKSLGIEENITSPTFTIISVYQGRLPLYHMDFYRIRDAEELALLGPEEYFFGEGVSAVEWPDLAEEFLPADPVVVEISILEDQRRRVRIRRDGGLR